MCIIADADETSRAKISGTLDSNFFVEAGAGSGKTTSLVSRMVSMVESGTDVSKICAITFTKAAANEFYARFQKKLIEGSSDPDSTERKRRLCRKAAGNIDLAFMGTIDSFCSMILREHPSEADIPAGTETVMPDEMDLLFRNEYLKAARGEYGSDMEKLSRKFVLTCQDPEGTFTDVIRSLWDARNSDIIWDRASAPKDASGIASCGEMKDLLLRLSGHEEKIYTKNAPSLEAWEYLRTKKVKISSDWGADVPETIYILKKIKGLRLTPDADPGSLGVSGEEVFRPHYTRGSLSWYEFDTESSSFPLEALEDLQYRTAMEFVTALMPLMEDSLRKQGKLDFFDCQYILRNMLRKDAASGGKLIRHIYSRHSYFLLDEFQDTNPIQTEIFFMLTSEKPDPDWRKCTPRPGSLFIVGDPKQSIYRFRLADVRAFMNVREIFGRGAGEVLELSRNFRSTVRMREWFNTAFTSLLPCDTEFQSMYYPIPIDDGENDPENEFTGVYRYPCTLRDPAPGDSDSEKVLETVNRIVGNPKLLVRSGRKEGLHKVGYGDIMIITPEKTHLGALMETLYGASVPFYVEGKVPFGDCPALRAAYGVISAASAPWDRFSTFSCDCMELPGMDGTENDARQMPFASLFENVFEKYRLFEKYGTRNMEYSYYALELLRDAECTGKVTSLSDAAAFLGNLIGNGSDVERSISLSDAGDRIHIANLHKVKGLEAPVVILADPQSRERKASFHSRQTDDGMEYRLISGGSIKTSAFPGEQNEANDCLAAERTRLLYVAATRAMSVLIVSDSILRSGASSESNPWYPLLDFIDDDVSSIPENTAFAVPERETLDVSELYDRASAESGLSDSDCLGPGYSLRRPSMAAVRSIVESEDDFEDVADESARTRTVRTDSAIIGTMVHRLMELFVSTKNGCDLDKTVREIVREYVTDEKDYVTILTNVGKTVRSGGFDQKNSVPRDILSELLGADEVHCEMPFCYRSPGTDDIWHGVMDVIYRKDGRWHIVDYKTNADPDDLDSEYREQLDGYVNAFRELTGNDADALIYHIDTGK